MAAMMTACPWLLRAQGPQLSLATNDAADGRLRQAAAAVRASPWRRRARIVVHDCRSPLQAAAVAPRPLPEILAMAPEVARLFPRLGPDRAAWVEYLLSSFTGELDDVLLGREGSLLRVRRHDRSIAVGPRRDFVSVYFRDTALATAFRRATGRRQGGRYTIHLRYFDDADLELVGELVRRALGWQRRGAAARPPAVPGATYGVFRALFAEAQLEADDLLLLEPFQIGYLPGWVPARELGALLRARPYLHQCLARRCPAAAPFLDEALAAGQARPTAKELARCEDRVVWTIADLLVYNKCPELYDGLPFHAWPFTEVTELADLRGKVVMDGGAGTGRVALEAARHAAVVWAVEPVGRLRQFIRERAREHALGNVHVVDGLLHDLPFPRDHFDVAITSHALGWRLDEELAELERVVRPGGAIVHCPGTSAHAGDEAQHTTLVSPPWSYDWAPMAEADGPKRKYWKRVVRAAQ